MAAMHDELTRCGELTVWQSAGLQTIEGLFHVFTTRGGGVSEGRFDSLNLGLHVHDDPGFVVANRRTVCEAAGFSPQALTCAEQVHGSEVAVVTDADAGRGAVSYIGSIPGTDALVTCVPGVPLALFFADCVPVFIVDPVNRAIGLAHAGWRGTPLGIVAETVAAMRREFGSSPQTCIAAVGPAIGPCCYRVSEDVADRIESRADESCVVREEIGNPLVDLKQANRTILTNAGLPEAQISVSTLCTSCRADLFYSHRRNGPTGRMAAVLAFRAPGR